MIRYSNNGIPLNPLNSHYNTGTPPQVGSPFIKVFIVLWVWVIVVAKL